ncbi:nucleoprotein [Actinovirus bernense]|uniref:Nucleoprotein n=1 Tax=Bern perch virus TaxID=2675847 RepID=A0A6G5X094_9VIRU|nr:nucleoprotein [Actinovirus bernense]QGM12353.1 nucleoprotein [Actinovirus bernense]
MSSGENGTGARQGQQHGAHLRSWDQTYYSQKGSKAKKDTYVYQFILAGGSVSQIPEEVRAKHAESIQAALRKIASPGQGSSQEGSSSPPPEESPGQEDGEEQEESQGFQGAPKSRLREGVTSDLSNMDPENMSGEAVSWASVSEQVFRGTQPTGSLSLVRKLYHMIGVRGKAQKQEHKSTQVVYTDSVPIEDGTRVSHRMAISFPNATSSIGKDEMTPSRFLAAAIPYVSEYAHEKKLCSPISAANGSSKVLESAAELIYDLNDSIGGFKSVMEARRAAYESLEIPNRSVITDWDERCGCKVRNPSCSEEGLRSILLSPSAPGPSSLLVSFGPEFGLLNAVMSDVRARLKVVSMGVLATADDKMKASTTFGKSYKRRLEQFGVAISQEKYNTLYAAASPYWIKGMTVSGDCQELSEKWVDIVGTWMKSRGMAGTVPVFW